MANNLSCAGIIRIDNALILCYNDSQKESSKKGMTMDNTKPDQPSVDQLRVKFLQLSNEHKQRVTGLMLGLEHAQEVTPPLSEDYTPVTHEGHIP